MPALAGTARMPYRRFLGFNATGGIMWGVVVVTAGHIAGSSYARVVQAIGRDGALIVLALALAAFTVWRVREHPMERAEGQPRSWQHVGDERQLALTGADGLLTSPTREVLPWGWSPGYGTSLESGPPSITDAGASAGLFNEGEASALIGAQPHERTEALDQPRKGTRAKDDHDRGRRCGAIDHRPRDPAGRYAKAWGRHRPVPNSRDSETTRGVLEWPGLPK